MSLTPVGFTALAAPSSVSSVAGFDALGLSGNGSPTASSTSSAAPAATSDPYQQAYDSLSTWSANYLLQAVEFGAPQIPQYTAGGTASSFAQLTTLLGQIAPAVSQGLYGNGTSVNTLA
ncbi:MAG: hypothetical protein KGN02_13230 [bacterium]|nr:hypothetical protein [bacterium]